jgi:chlorophyll synthase
MWAFACGAISAGVPGNGKWITIATGVVLAGPLVCATSQAANDWFDREVDAINEPHRPIPSGRMPGRWGLYVAQIWTVLSLLVASTLGQWGFAAASLGLLLAWAYSAPPFRLKLNGWWGNAACAISYEGLAWVTGAAVMLGGEMPSAPSMTLALLYSIGAHGIMTLNDFKSIEGDRQMGVGSLPVRLGATRAACVASFFMAISQLIVAACLLYWGLHWQAGVIGVLLTVQVLMMVRLVRSPVAKAVWYSGLGVTLYVSGMMVSAFAIRGMAQ